MAKKQITTGDQVSVDQETREDVVQGALFQIGVLTDLLQRETKIADVETWDTVFLCVLGRISALTEIACRSLDKVDTDVLEWRRVVDGL